MKQEPMKIGEDNASIQISSHIPQANKIQSYHGSQNNTQFLRVLMISELFKVHIIQTPPNQHHQECEHMIMLNILIHQETKRRMEQNFMPPDYLPPFLSPSD
ncbi:hypothetical protein CHS0354_043095 [Potamilus streckersoni]|uniref:Uncharacterized protein n=1 Tax=Potamilus streckersoni TaxID=2493646 RepID=A0AAE0RMI8_9BIVA|nr:hypothetical protein CHS0354_043095 [Potamilus streckersoni]